MDADKEKIMRLVKEIEHDFGRCNFKMLEESLELRLRGETLVKLLKELDRYRYVRIDSNFRKDLDSESRRDIVRIWSN